MASTIGEVARSAGVTVRTLRHYDAVGLLSPQRRTAAGYRLYGEAELARLQRILAYKELGFDLPAIRRLLEGDDDETHLKRQADLLDRRVAKLQAMRVTLRRTMEARRMGVNLTAREMLEVFGDDDPTAHAEEAEQRWGDSEAWRQSSRRTARYGKEEWLRVRDEGDAIEERLAQAARQRLPADGPVAMDAAEDHRRYIGRWFYDCSLQMHRGLAEMYLADPRFTDHYERREPGLAAYLAAAIRANADRQAEPPGDGVR